MIKLRAPAKVNLTLEVLRRRPDGYHEVATILQAVGLWDELVLEEAQGLSFRCSVPELDGPDNLVVKAAKLLASEAKSAKSGRGADISLTKRIPIAGGLGGGSADAAAALAGLNALWELGLSHERLSVLAAQLGSDVPFFLSGGTAIATGRGELVTSLRAVRPAWLVVLAPDVTLPRKTASLYGALTPADYADGRATERAVALLAKGAAVNHAMLVNTFERVAYRVFPSLASFADAMRAAGAERVHLAGSGPSLFTPAPDEAAGNAMAERLSASGLRAWCVPTVASGVTFVAE